MVCLRPKQIQQYIEAQIKEVNLPGMNLYGLTVLSTKMESLVVVAFQLCRLAAAAPPGRSAFSPSAPTSGRPQSPGRLRGYGYCITACRRLLVSPTLSRTAIVSVVSRIDSPTKEDDLSILTISSDCPVGQLDINTAEGGQKILIIEKIGNKENIRQRER